MRSERRLRDDVGDVRVLWDRQSDALVDVCSARVQRPRAADQLRITGRWDVGIGWRAIGCINRRLIITADTGPGPATTNYKNDRENRMPPHLGHHLRFALSWM